MSPTEDAEIDAGRIRRRSGPVGDAGAYLEGLVLGNAWLHLLQRQGVSVDAILPAYDALVDAVDADDEAAAWAAVDAFFIALEGIQSERPTMLVDPQPATRDPQPATRDPRSATRDQRPATHDPRPATRDPRPATRAWPLYGGNPQHTACIDVPGPTRGREAWRLPVGLAWYASPAVVDGRVYAASPGLRSLAWCLDLASGEVVWKAGRDWSGLRLGRSSVLPQSYTTQAVASTPVVLGDTVAFAELGAQGRDRGRRHVTWLDRATGAVRRRTAVDEADYRMGSARLAGHAGGLVVPTGTQRIQGTPSHAGPHDRVVCLDPVTGEPRWDLRVGPTQAVPVVDEELAYIGTSDGTFFALRLSGETPELKHFGSTDSGRIAWSRSFGCGANAPAALADGLVVVGVEDGRVIALERTTGAVRWETPAVAPEPRARQLFSGPLVRGDRVYLGAAPGVVVCLDLVDGALRWTHAVDDWVRARPVACDDAVVVATLDGAVIALADDGDGAVERWRARPGEHAIFADPVAADGAVLVTDGRLCLRCLDGATGALRWQRHLLDHVVVDGRETVSDEMACGGWYQSKPTAAEGTVYVGTPSRFVVAVDAATGVLRWRSELSGAVSGSPSIADGRILVGQQGGADEFRCLDAATGEPLWTQQLGWVWSSATVAGDLAYTCGTDGSFTCLEVATGHIRWRYRSGAAAHPEPPVDDGRVFFGSWDHYVYAFDARSGKLLWQFHTGGTPDSGAPIASGGKLYVPMGGLRFCCLEAATGELLWEYTPKLGCMNGSPALRGDRLFISTSVRSSAIPPTCRIRCLDAATGEELWDVPGGGITAPAIAGDRLYTASTSDNGFACYRLDGDAAPACEWRIPMGDRVYESVPAIHGGRAFILCEDGFLHAFE